ncbi:L-threonine dehydratase catabolic TdcB protein [Marine Group I thaumarchaeote SCGC AAA799-B03]|uniref:threonine ammonia-lyase n=3 Tax=Marine Group I TaxID=905826 RepID=A0A087S8I2_9ARCH|nr:L-threonine dehydratase catabolic TdcB protein [Marine Group I thaumarchaeote SCGC AAA799-N04]KFM18062.1 L-threonine dehydratase catabolic TdcB protein [Marine Group I thaumarchaeote SCGC RSA3]KFM22036.1 L-threonine dehydratase catabolic TdcB protein [Marine Group I thaumarchaeote SCGC AAA799-B03]
MNPTFAEIEKANSLRGNEIKKTPLIHSPTFSELTKSEVYLKAEFRQKTGSFKIRGAYYKIKSLSDDEKKHGVVAASAGNHAQGVALASALEEIPCTIVMPKNASPAKVAATRGYGANVILEGINYDESSAKAKEIANETGATMIHAFDDPQIIAAQGVIGLEILDDLPDVEEVYLPIGGGGLAAGTLIAIKEKNPNIKVIGVQSRSFPSMYESIKQGAITASGGARTIADGISVKVPGQLTFSIINKLIDEIVLVDDTEITKAMFLLMERMKFVVEPAGAVSLAYLISKKPAPGKKVVAVLAGGNVDMYLLGQIVDKGLAAMGRLLKLSILLPDRPGAFKDIVDEITLANANIVEVVHDRLSSNVNAGSAAVTMNLETQGKEQADALIEALRQKNVQFTLLT